MALRAKKKYGQHFLEAAWADKLVAAIDPRPGERFIEIGPGPGALTLRLAPLAGEVTAVELDGVMVEALRPKLSGNVTLIHADFLDVDVASITRGHPSRVVGNLPYNVSSPILFRLVEVYRTTGALIDATLMLQREVADRITAAPGTGEYGVLSISAQMHADVRRVLTLPPGAFRPPPKVHSAVVQFRFRPPAVALADARLFESMVRSIFTQRRKTLQNALGPFAASHHREPGAALASAGIDPRRRPETLQLTELARLADYFVSSGERAVL
jgi:16S rRNA (adenine1518-N6/adenine1519-N6)-dimethyltransferase